MLHKNLTVKKGRLQFAGVDTVEMAKKYSTPLMLLDEEGIRETCREYNVAVRQHFTPDSSVAYASKALSFVGLNKILKEEGMSLDVASAGEIHTADVAGFDMGKTYFHSNFKTAQEIQFALGRGVGHLMVDNPEELEFINDIACKQGIRQKVFLRLTPGIKADTFKQVVTGAVDSKFGVTILGEKGDENVAWNYISTNSYHAEKFVADALGMRGIELCGYHCHIGSQIFDSAPFEATVEKMLRFSAMIKEKYGYQAPEIILGGGFAVRYKDDQPMIDYTNNIRKIGDRAKSVVDELGLNMPRIGLEPGRSIVAPNGLSLYTVGSVKRIPHVKNYVITDGSMADSPRYAYYQSPYTFYNASDMTQETQNQKRFRATIAGRACESGDILQENVEFGLKPNRGDILARATSGAYEYPLSSNYNRIGRPAIVAIDKNGNDRVVVRRETIDDIIKNDVR